MATITTLNSTDNGSTSRTTINTNFTNLNTAKLENANVAVSTTEIYVDVNRADSYTPNGSMLNPYKSISTAVAAMIASSYTSFVIRLAPGTYTEASSVTFPSKPVVIYGQGSTFVAVSGVTFPKQFDVYDLTIVGNVIQSDTSTTTIHNFQSGYIQGNITVSGLCAFNGMATDTGGTLTINSGAIMTVSSSSLGSRIVNNGTLYFNSSSLVRTDNTYYTIDSSGAGSVMYASGSKVVNQGTGGGINISNGATTTPNELSNIDVVVNNTVNAITAGTARTYLTTYTAFNLGGTAVLPTGSNFLTALNGGGVIASGLSSTSSIVMVSNSPNPSAGQILTATSSTNATWQNPAATLASGLVIDYALQAVTADYTKTNGAAISRSGGNASLFAAIGTTFGVGDGSTTFNVPLYSNVPTTSLVSYWRLDGNSNDGVASNNGTDTAISYSAANGVLGQGAGFNGSTSTISLPNIASLSGSTARTFSCWFYSTSSAALGTLYSEGVTTALNLFIARLNDSTATIAVNFGDGGLVSGTNAYVINRWNHLVVTYDGGAISVSTVHVYLNGVPVTMGAYSGTAGTANTTNSNFGIGYLKSGSTQLFTGNIDEVGVWNRSLTIGEVIALYNYGVGTTLTSASGTTGSFLTGVIKL